MSKAKIIIVAAELDKLIGKLSKDSGALASGIQLALASATYHAVAHGNVNPVNTLFTSLSKGVRKAALQAWLLAHAPVAVQTDKDKAKEAPFAFMRDRVAALVETDKPTGEQAEAYATKVLSVDWTAYKPEQLVPESFDVLAMLKQMVDRAEGLAKKGSKPQHGELIEKLRALTAPQEVAPL